MSSNSAPSLRLEPSAPRFAAAGLVVLAALAAYAIGVSGLVLAWKLFALLLAGALLAYSMRTLSSPWPLLEWDTAGMWWLHDSWDGGKGAARPDPCPAELIGAMCFGPMLLLRLRIDGRRRALLLTPDRLPNDDLRRLRVRLGL